MTECSKNDEGMVLDADAMAREREVLRESGKTVVFTNGCFDVLHAGHADYLAFSKRQGDVLVVGLNSDISTKALKGNERPIVPQSDRARLLTALRSVDYVVIFDEKEPAGLIEKLVPDVLVKGEDWSHYVSGREIVEAHGGRVVLAPLTEGRSSTGVIDRIKSIENGTGQDA